MTTYTGLSAGAVGVGGIPSGSTVTALRDNPVAIAEGSTGAPRIAAIARTCVKVFGGTSGSTGLVVTGLAGYGGVTLDMTCVAQATGNLVMNVSMNNGSSWSADYNIFDVLKTPATSEDGAYYYEFLSAHGYYNFANGAFKSNHPKQLTTTETGAINALRFRTLSCSMVVTPDAGLIAL
jgi:hypothetical protein